MEDVTNTTENRRLTFVKIGTGGPDKPAIVIDGAIHARKWISPSVVLYLIQQLVENPENAEMIENVNWYIFPVLNPDGYEFSHTNVSMNSHLVNSCLARQRMVLTTQLK